MKALALKLLREIGIDTPNVDAVVARKLTEPAVIYEYVHGLAEELRARRDDAEDERQGWLDIPEYRHVHVKPAETLEEFRRGTEAIAARLKSYSYPRRSEEKKKADQAELRERRRLDKNVAPFFLNDPRMTMEWAAKLLQQRISTPSAQQRRKAIKSRWDRKKGRTKNQ